MLSGGKHFMESDESYYRRRATQELAAARRAVTQAAQERRRRLAETYLQRLVVLTGQEQPLPAAAFAPARNWILD